MAWVMVRSLSTKRVILLFNVNSVRSNRLNNFRTAVTMYEFHTYYYTNVKNIHSINAGLAVSTAIVINIMSAIGNCFTSC